MKLLLAALVGLSSGFASAEVDLEHYYLSCQGVTLTGMHFEVGAQYAVNPELMRQADPFSFTAEVLSRVTVKAWEGEELSFDRSVSMNWLSMGVNDDSSVYLFEHLVDRDGLTFTQEDFFRVATRAGDVANSADSFSFSIAGATGTFSNAVCERYFFVPEAE